MPLSNPQEALADALLAFGFAFNGHAYTFVIRRSARLWPGEHGRRVDVFEDGVPCGTCYLHEEDGPMADASHYTPLALTYVKESDDGVAVSFDFMKWGIEVGKAWEVVKPVYRLRAAKENG